MESLGSLIEGARTRLALSQNALAARLGVKQQTVSRWEKGQSKPQRTMLPKLAGVLEVPLEDLTGVIAASPRETSSSMAMIPPAVRPLVDVLPLHSLPPERFEQFVADLQERRYPDATVSRLGGPGDDQRGFDIVIRHGDGHRVGIQCKREKKFGPKKIEGVVADAELDVDESVIALARQASSAARFEMDKHPRWTLWDQDDLSRQVRKLALDSAVRLIDTYFPGYRKPFLNVSAPGPWLTVDEFFPDSPTTLLHHRQALAGRTPIVKAIVSWVNDASPATVGVLVGRGGLGKSKLLFEVATQKYTRRTEFCFLAVGLMPTPESFDLLPNDDNLVVVIDDAHNIDSVAAIAAQLRLRRPTAKLLLASRPYGETLLDIEIWKLNQSPRAIARWKLEDLSGQEIAKLVSDLINRPANDPMTRQLAAISADCPFVAVVAADLLKRGSLAARTFSSSTDLRIDVLQRFTEVATSDGSASAISERRSILAALSAFQPVRLNEPDFQAVMVELTGGAAWDAISGRIRELEDSGLVLRHGNSVRVVPDMLGDILLGQAAFDERSQIATTYLERAQSAAMGAPLQHLLVNASRIDWQVHDGSQTDLVDGLWEVLREELGTGTYEQQMQMLGLVAKMAFYQPELALSVVNDVMNLEPDAEVGSTGEQWSSTRQDVVNAIPSILKNIAYNFEYLTPSLELLWALAQDDTRPTNQLPGHPLRILTELADFHTGKPLSYIDALIDAAEGWFDDSDGGCVSPFDVLDPILATEGSDETFDEMTLTFHPFGIRPEAVRGVRSRVIDLAERQVERGDPAGAIRALRTLEQAIREPVGMYSRTPTAQEKASWVAEFLPVISKLGSIGSDPKHDPVVRIAIRHALSWHAEYSVTQTKEAAQEALRALVATEEDDLAVCLHDGWGRLGMRSSLTYEEVERAKNVEFTRVATALASRQSEEMLHILRRRLRIERAAFGNKGAPGPFLWFLFEASPDVAALLCEESLSNAQEELLEFVPLAISSLAGAGDPRAMEFSVKMTATPSRELSRAVAWGFSWNRGPRTHLLDGELELLAQLARSADEVVRAAMGRAVYALGLSNKAAASQLLSALQFGGSEKVASESLSSFIPPGPLNWTETDRSLRESVIKQLVECDSIDSYAITTSIAELSRVEPIAVTRLLMARIDRQATQGVLSRTALPDQWDRGLKIRETPELARCLVEVRDWLTKTDWDRPHFLYDDGARLYTLVAGEWDKQALTVLDNFDTGNPRAAVLAVARILGQAPQSVIFNNTTLVIKTLRRAEELGGDAAKLASQAMVAAATFTARSTWGSVAPPEDVEQRDRAAEIAKKLPRGSIEAKFYQSLVHDAEGRIRWLTESPDWRSDGRDW